MSVSLDRVLAALSEEERIFAEADAAALGLSMAEYVAELVRDGLRSEDDFGMPLVH